MGKVPGWDSECAARLKELLVETFRVSSVRDLARCVGLSPSHLAEVLGGRRALTWQTLGAFASALQIPPEEVLQRVGCVGAAGEPRVPAPLFSLGSEEKEVLLCLIASMDREEFAWFRRILPAFFLIAGKGDLFIARGLEAALSSPEQATRYLSSASEENLLLAYHALLFWIDPVLYAGAGNLALRPTRNLSVPQELREKVLSECHRRRADGARE